MEQEKKNKIATNSFILIFVQAVTLCTGIVKSMIFSRTLDKFDYGTYNQGLFVVSFISPFIALGLSNAVNYFYNKTEKIEEKQKYVNTIFSMTVILGITGAAGIILFRPNIVAYFNNTALFSLLIYAAFMPLLLNLIALYHPLYISNGMAKAIAVRNLIISISQLMILGIISVVSQNIVLMFIILLILDIMQVVIFGFYFNIKCFKIKLFKLEYKFISSIVKYAVPMALATVVGTLSLAMDKMIIGKMMSVEDFALYSNVSRELPFNIITSSFTTIIMPVIIGLYSSNQINKLKNLWSDYLEIGYISTWTLCAGAIVCARELVLFLYSDKYIGGVNIFIVYLCVSMIRFTYFGIILTASGKTKWIFINSIGCLTANFILTIMLFNVLGIIGPSIATFISVALSMLIMFIHNLKILKCKISDVINIKRLLFFVFQLILTGLLIYYCDKMILSKFVNINFVKLFIKYSLYLFFVFIINMKRIRQILSQLNRVR